MFEWEWSLDIGSGVSSLFLAIFFHYHASPQFLILSFCVISPGHCEDEPVAELAA